MGQIDSKTFRAGTPAPSDLYITTDPTTSERTLDTEVKEGLPQQNLAIKGRRVRQGVADVIDGIQSRAAEDAKAEQARQEAEAEAAAADKERAEAEAAAAAAAEKEAKAAAAKAAKDSKPAGS